MRHLSKTATFTDDQMSPAPEPTLGTRTIRVGGGEPEPVLLVEQDHTPRFTFADGRDATAFVASAVYGGAARNWVQVALYLGGEVAQLSPEAEALLARTRLERGPGRQEFGPVRLRRWFAHLASAAGWNRWIVIRLRETPNWCDAVRALADEVWGVFAYDALTVTHCAEAAASYELLRLGSMVEGRHLPEEDAERLDELLREGDSQDGANVYMHCREIDGLPVWQQHVVGFVPPVDFDVFEVIGDADDLQHVWVWESSAERYRLVEATRATS